MPEDWEPVYEAFFAGLELGVAVALLVLGAVLLMATVRRVFEV